jgi:hypothetical protein
VFLLLGDIIFLHGKSSCTVNVMEICCF